MVSWLLLDSMAVGDEGGGSGGVGGCRGSVRFYGNAENSEG